MSLTISLFFNISSNASLSRISGDISVCVILENILFIAIKASSNSLRRCFSFEDKNVPVPFQKDNSALSVFPLNCGLPAIVALLFPSGAVNNLALAYSVQKFGAPFVSMF